MHGVRFAVVSVQPNDATLCGTCATANEVGRKFCKECGSPLARTCASCGAPNSPDSKFCGECGTSLAPATPRTTGTTTVATERRLVSVLFADLVGFTTLSEHRDAEDVRDLLSRYFDEARQAIERHGGLVEKFIGDAVMAVWGTPAAHEDDAERAVRAALEIVDAVDGLGNDVGMELRARAGVLTGEAATLAGGVSEGIVVGDLVNTASRLQAAAEPGVVLVGDATYRAASRAVAFAEVGQLRLKGKEETVRAWHALRVIGERGGSGRVVGLEPPFVGRAEELRSIKELLHGTEREGRARLISVMGIGGIGKSRLAWEFRKYVDGLAGDVYWHQGRCLPYGDGVAFWALGEMVRMRAGIAETNDPAESRGKLAAAAERYVSDPEERRWIEPRLSHLLGLEERPAGERDELFSAWRTFFERIAERGPTVMVFEDLQWADPGLLDFVESTLEWSRDLPILIVTLARPELSDRRPTWGTNQRSFTSIRLEPLPAPVMTELVTGFVPELADAEVERIVSRSEGVPLYAVETVRMLADRGVLEPRGEGYAVVGDVGSLEVPETLHALIAARLDALTGEDRALLQDASVLGKSFTLAALAAVNGSDPSALEVRLNELARKEFLLHEGDPRSPERGQYTFLQSLIREVAYSTLPKAERRKRHLAAAHHLETQGDEELASVVATHYVEAFRASKEGPDAQALAARARDWLGQAAERAQSLGSPEQALAYAEQALEITPEGAERAALLARAGEAAQHAAKIEQAIGFFDEAIDLHRANGDVEAVARLTARQGQSLVFLNRGKELVERCETALAALGGDDERPAAELYECLAVAHFLRGEPERALQQAERGLALAERFDLQELFGRLLRGKTNALFSLGRHREAVLLSRGWVDAARQLDNHTALSSALMNLGVLSSEADPRMALDAFLRSVDSARKAGDRLGETMGLANAAESAIDVGDFERADAVLAELEGRDLPDNSVAAVALDRALLAAYRGTHPAASEYLEGIASYMEGSDMIPLKTWYLRTISFVRLLAGDLEGAYTSAVEAIEPDPTGMNASTAIWGGLQAALLQRDGAKVREMLEATSALRGPWIEAVRSTAEAGLSALEGRTAEATAGFQRAMQAWTALDLPLDLALCVIDAASVLPAEAVPEGAVATAQETLEGLRVTPLLARLAAAASRDPADATSPAP